jgi:hypothetical protein
MWKGSGAVRDIQKEHWFALLQLNFWPPIVTTLIVLCTTLTTHTMHQLTCSSSKEDVLWFVVNFGHDVAFFADRARCHCVQLEIMKR